MIGVNRIVLISCATEVLSLFHGTAASHFGLVEEFFLFDSLNSGRENLDMNVWVKSPHKVLDSLGAIAFPLPDHGSRLSGPSGVWGGFTPFMLLLSLKAILLMLIISPSWALLLCCQTSTTKACGTWSVLYSPTFTAPLLNNVWCHKYLNHPASCCVSWTLKIK